MRMKRGGCSREVPAARFLQGGYTLNRGRPRQELPICYCKLGGGGKGVATACAAHDVQSCTFYENNSCDLDMVSDNSFWPGSLQNQHHRVYLKSPGSEFTAVTPVKPH